MSEKAPGQYPLSVDEKIVLHRKDLEIIETAIKKLDEVAQAVGYTRVDTFEKLALTPQEIQKIHYRSLAEKIPPIIYYSADRKDRKKAKIIVRPRTDGCYFAEFISPGHQGGNHDFSLSEMQGNMKLYLELEPTQTK